MRLEGQVIWITGSAKRVGKECALTCAAEGADIVVHYRGSRAEAEATAEEIRALGRRALLVQGDQSSQEDVRRMMGEIREGFGRLTALVNSASAFPSKKFEDVTEEDFFSIISTNLWGPFLCAREALGLLRESRPARIVNLTDWAVARPYRNYAHYMASKGGLDVLTRALARELAPDVLVNAIAPGPVLEPPDISDENREKVLGKIPVGRWGTPDAVAKALLFLLESDFVTGETVTVDGGRTVG